MYCIFDYIDHVAKLATKQCPSPSQGLLLPTRQEHTALANLSHFMTETITLRYFATVHGRLMHRYACFTIPSNASVLAAIQEIEKQIKYSALDILLWKVRLCFCSMSSL